MLIAALVSIGLISRSTDGGAGAGGGGDGGGAGGGGTVPTGGAVPDESLDPPPQAVNARQIAKIWDVAVNFIRHLSADNAEAAQTLRQRRIYLLLAYSLPR
jgi:hypothetical protein